MSSAELYPSSPAARVGRWMLALLIPGSAVAIGSVHRGTLLFSSLVTAILLILVWLVPVSKVPRNARWVAFGAGVLVLFTLFQAIPLPSSVVRVIAPANADIWDRALAVFGEKGPEFHPITIAPTMTYEQVLRGLLYLSVFMATVRLVAADLGAFIERAIVISTAFMGMLALAHPAVGADRVLGLYRPRNLYAFATNYYAPLLNPNHLAAYLNIGACLSLASLLSSKPLFPRPLLATLALFLAGTSVWAASRGGMGSLAIGIGTIALIKIWTRSRHSQRTGQLAIAALIGVASAIMIGFAGSDAARNELANTDLGKFRLAATSLKLVSEAPWFGFGRGGFEDVFARVRHDTHYVTYTNPENIIAQWVTEWGVPVSLLCSGTFLWAFRPETLLARARPAVGAWTAIVVSVVHDLVDYHLEVPGVMIPIAVCGGLVLGRRAATHAGEGRTFQRGMFAIAAATLGAAVLVLSSPSQSLADDREQLSKLAIDSSIAPSAFQASERSAMLRHPAEPFLPLMGAVRAQLFGEGSVVAWTGAALERYPRFGRAHLVLANSLFKRNPSQARLEYRLAYEYDVGLRQDAILEGAKLVTGLETAHELVVEGAERVKALELVSGRIGKRLPSTAFELDTEILRLDPSNDAVLAQRAADAVSDLINVHPWCAVDDCGALATRATEANLRAHRDQCAAHLLHARATVNAVRENDQRLHAVDELTAAIDEVTDRARCQRSVLELMLELRDYRYIDSVLHSLISAGCSGRAECVELFLWVAQFEERRQREVTALVYYKRAFDSDHDREDALEAILRIATKHGLFVDASAAAESLSLRHPGDPDRAAVASAMAARLREQQRSGANAPSEKPRGTKP